MTEKKEECYQGPPECLLHNKVIQRRAMSQCFRCGWYEPEARSRRMLLAAKGLTMCSDGLRRLVMPARNPDCRSDTE